MNKLLKTVFIYLQMKTGSCSKMSFATSTQLQRSDFFASKADSNVKKKVLLRERKRHTSRRVASTHSAAVFQLGGGGVFPHPVLIGGGMLPSSHDGGCPPSSPDGGYSHLVMMGGTPSSPDGGVPSVRFLYPPSERMKFRADITRSSKQAISGPTKKTYVLQN